MTSPEKSEESPIENKLKNQEESDDEDETNKDNEEGTSGKAPVELSGCRARKKVERLSYNTSTVKPKVEIEEGSGAKLGECPRIELKIQKTPAQNLKHLHRVLFNRVGSAHEVKKNIKKFSGFLFKKGSSEYDKKKMQLEKLTNSDLKKICEVIDIERQGTKEDLSLRILDFLLEPKPSEKSLPKKKKSSGGKQKAKAKKEKKTDTENLSNESGSENQSSSEKEESSGEEETETKPSVKKRKSSNSETASSDAGKKVCKSDHVSDEIPTDNDIKKYVEELLKDANLHTVTMKTIIHQVAEKYPSLDIPNKKAFIKECIKKIIS